ncbi:hypothetical protein NPIL_688781 [Nephila pilipes]|uniref:Uncharacterized protein n=1 Tax=Nephila pilipes TaxID=299642 RepID=A0A8X6US11_NEPPI|nr:hypothetical protein NPIL_688781 [Nephila pilipes]
MTRRTNFEMNEHSYIWTLDSGFLPRLKERVRRSCLYVDEILGIMKEEGVFHKSLPEEFIVYFPESKIPLSNLSIEVLFENWHMRGLDTFYRAGDCLLSEVDDRFLIEAVLGVQNLKFDCDSHFQLWRMFPYLGIEGSVESIIFNLTFSVELGTGWNAHVHKFYIGDLVGLKVWFTGEGFFKTSLSAILQLAVSMFKYQIQKQLEIDIRYFFKYLLPRFRFPPLASVVSSERN